VNGVCTGDCDNDDEDSSDDDCEDTSDDDSSTDHCDDDSSDTSDSKSGKDLDHGPFCTYRQSTWGSKYGAVNDKYKGLLTRNPGILPIRVGAPDDLSVTVQSQNAMTCFLPTLGGAQVLCTDLANCLGDMAINACANPPILDPLESFTKSGGQGAGALAGEAIALKGNVALSKRGATPRHLSGFLLRRELCTRSGYKYRRFTIHASIATGTNTVADLLMMADQALRDPTVYEVDDPVTREDVTAALRAVNEAFDGCAEVVRCGSMGEDDCN
jgi:hypothetical protein